MYLRAHTGIGWSAVVALVLWAAPAAAPAQDLSLDDVLERATNYVYVLHHQLSGMVAEERYEQRARAPAPALRLERRTLRSDYLLIRPSGSERPYGFRDVFEVDGRPVRDRADRLSRLFLDPSVSSDRQIQGILADSARYNIGAIRRTVNTPTLPLVFLSKAYRSRFEFERETGAAPELEFEEFQPPPDAWVVAYRETWPTTIIGGREGKHVPAKGRFWIEPVYGRVLASELVLEDGYWVSIIDVRYALDQRMGHFVPVEMRERYDQRRRGHHVEGIATYTEFRRFRVVVDEGPAGPR